MTSSSRQPVRVTALVVVSGAALMALEIAGSRVLAPYFGGSIYVWGSLIGIFLGAMSGGYWIGGWLSERWPRQMLLNALLALAGGFVLLLPLWAGPLCRSLLEADIGARSGPLSAALFLFALPSALMGVTTPFAVRLLARELAGVGGVAGRLYALGTLGSIAGTLLTAFWLIPQLGVNAILTGIGALLLVTALLTLPLGLPPSRRQVRDFAVLLLAALLLSAWRFAQPVPGPLKQPDRGKLELVEERDSAYGHLLVTRHLWPTSGGSYTPVVTSLQFGDYVQGAVFVNAWQRRGREHWSAAGYTDLFHLARLFVPAMRRVLFIGGGVGVGPRSFLRQYPAVAVDLVEIDPVVVELGRKYFALDDHPRLRIVIADGRNFLRRHQGPPWDLIVLDAFNAGGRPPFHLMTREFLQQAARHLTADGVLLANLTSALTGEKSRLFRAQYLTYAEVFPQVYVFPRHSPVRSEPAPLASWFDGADGGTSSAELPAVHPITDDYAPVDTMVIK